MTDVRSLIVARPEAGVYRWRATEPARLVRQAVRSSGWHCYLLDGARITDTESFLTGCAEALGLPDRHTQDWDSLGQALTELRPAPGYVLVYDSWMVLATADPAGWRRAKQLLTDAVDTWWHRDVAMYVLLRGQGPDPDLPVLPD